MATQRTLLLIAGAKSHGPEGNGAHDYGWDATVAAAMLVRSDVGDRMRVRVVADRWPEPGELADADAIALFCDGRDGDLYAEALHLAGADRVAEVRALMARGCGLAVIHFGTFAPEALAGEALGWCGGYFQWQGDDGARAWRSRITTLEAEVEPVAGHPATRGLRPFRLREEFYHDLRFPATEAPGWTPLLRAPALPAVRERGDVVAWALERPDGGRGFGTTLGHFHANWRDASYRTALLNGLAWCAGVEVPAAGVRAPWLSRDDAARVLAGRADDALPVLLLAGNDAHRWHNWERTTPAIVAALGRDPRVRVDVVHDPEAFARRDLSGYGAIALNYCNWHDPAGIPPAAREALAGYVARGGGLLVLHFANGAFHRSLPQAGASDWPEYRRLVRRVWDHDADSTHDRYRRFTAHATPAGHGHPITEGLAGFAVDDELYVRQRGDEPIEPILQARSEVTGGDEPLAWTYAYGRGRVFQTLLGHSERTYEAFGAREMLRRAAAWCARREIRRTDPADDAVAAPVLATAAAR